MPIYHVTNKSKHYFQYGNTGKKYYFNIRNIGSITDAYNKVLKQNRAIHSNKRKK